MESTENSKEKTGINGWLLVLCFQLLIFNPVLLLSVLGEQNLLLFIKTVPAIVLIDVIVSTLLLGLGFIAGVRLLSRGKTALRSAGVYLVANIAYNFVLVIVALFEKNMIIRKNFPLIFISVLVSIGWYAYLHKSTRVRNVYNNIIMYGKKICFSQAVVVVILLTMTLSLIFVKKNYQVFYIPTESMRPTIHAGDYVLVKKIKKTGFGRGDIVVFVSSSRKNRLYVKRVIAIAGDRFYIKNNQVYVNNQGSSEPYVLGKTAKEINAIQFEEKVPRHKIIVLGDNREHSEDSRHFGYVGVENIRGKVVWIATHRNYWK